MTLNGAMALLRYFAEFTYNIVLKQLLGLHPFQNLLLIVYDHINYDLRDYSASIWAKQQEATASNSECSLPTPMSHDEFLVSLAMGASICGAKRVGRASPF